MRALSASGGDVVSRDPGHADGNQTYRPPPPLCVCGHDAYFHVLTTRRGACWTYRGGIRCPCRAYTPKLAPAGGAAEHRPPPAGAVQSTQP
jgi:hypothetical protein